MLRRSFLASSLAAVAAPKRRPNIVWIMADDMGWGDPGCYGQKHIRTPHIDQLASEGMRFTDAYAGCTVCAPSRSVLMTGTHMGHTSVRSNPGGVPILASDVTVAQVLKQANYATGMFGKWGLGDIGTDGVPWKHGFDEFCGFLHQMHAHYQYPERLFVNDKLVPVPGNEGRKRGTYANDFMMAKALQWLQRVGRSQPFFCYLPLTIPHWEPLAPEKDLAAYAGKFPEPKPWEDKSGRLASNAAPRATYAAMVSKVDSYVGQVMKQLKDANVAEDTLVFFTSDNGGHFSGIDTEDYFRTNGPFRGYKTTLYEGGLRAPMIARMPGRIRAGSVSSYAWNFMDFLPTAAEVAGVGAPKGIDGWSVMPTLTGKKQKAHEYLYWELPGYNAAKGEFRDEKPPAALRAGDWKILRPKADAPLELYNLKADLSETKDLAATDEARLASMAALLAGARTVPRPQAQPPHPWVRES